jgi:hypothetical protein
MASLSGAGTGSDGKQIAQRGGNHLPGDGPPRRGYGAGLLRGKKIGPSSETNLLPGIAVIGS